MSTFPAFVTLAPATQQLLFVLAMLPLVCLLLWPQGWTRRSGGDSSRLLLRRGHGSPETVQTKVPSPTAEMPGWIAADKGFSRVAEYIHGNGARLHGVHLATASAARQIDTAEMALHRLIREVSVVMPSAAVDHFSAAR